MEIWLECKIFKTFSHILLVFLKQNIYDKPDFLKCRIQIYHHLEKLWHAVNTVGIPEQRYAKAYQHRHTWLGIPEQSIYIKY